MKIITIPVPGRAVVTGAVLDFAAVTGPEIFCVRLGNSDVFSTSVFLFTTTIETLVLHATYSYTSKNYENN